MGNIIINTCRYIIDYIENTYNIISARTDDRETATGITCSI